jgi:hypothetical protein
MNELELAFLNSPVQTVIFLIFILSIFAYISWKYLLYPILRYVVVLFLGLKAAKGIFNELKKGKE